MKDELPSYKRPTGDGATFTPVSDDPAGERDGACFEAGAYVGVDVDGAGCLPRWLSTLANLASRECTYSSLFEISGLKEPQGEDIQLCYPIVWSGTYV